MEVKSIIKLRTGKSTEWASTTGVPSNGEPLYDIDNNILKIGDGNKTWGNLPAIDKRAMNYTDASVKDLVDNFSDKLSDNGKKELAEALQPYLKSGMLVASTENEMDEIARDKDNLGQVVKYIGDDGKYTKNTFYLIEEDN